MTEDHPSFVSRFDTLGIHDTSARCGEVLHTTPPRTIHIVREWEERIGRAGDTRLLRHMLGPLVRGELCGRLIEVALPLRSLSAFRLEGLTGDEEVDCVGFIRSFRTFLERQGEDSRVMSEPPDIRLVSCQSCTVDAGLLAGAEANDGPIECVADRIGLCILERQGCYYQVDNGGSRELNSVRTFEAEREGRTSFCSVTTFWNSFSSITQSFLLCCMEIP